MDTLLERAQSFANEVELRGTKNVSREDWRIASERTRALLGEIVDALKAGTIDAKSALRAGASANRATMWAQQVLENWHKTQNVIKLPS